MVCFICKKQKLAAEMTEDSLSPDCDHAFVCCLQCTVEALGKELNCPWPNCHVAVEVSIQEEIRQREGAMYRPLSHTGGLLTHTPQPTITISLLTGQSVEIEYSPELPLSTLLTTAAEQFNLDPRKIVILNNDEILKISGMSVAEAGIEPGAEMSAIISPYGIFAGLSHILGAKLDQFGNAQGAEYDLAEDGAFAGLQIAVLLFSGEGFDFACPSGPLRQKGFSITLWTTLPSIDELKATLKKSCQLWIISTTYSAVPAPHIVEIKRFFEQGGGVFIWGDNDPLNVVANDVCRSLLPGTRMSGNYIGTKCIRQNNTHGFLQHLVTTGLDSIYEGYTIAQVTLGKDVKPMMRSSDGNVVTAYYDADGKRAMIDGGFTRLYRHFWSSTAGTSRFVINSAAWLCNFERMLEDGRWPGQ